MVKELHSDVIDIVIDFIKSHGLGQTEFFGLDKEEAKYSEIEKKRLQLLLDIVENFANDKLSEKNLQPEIKNQLQLPDDLAREISEKIKASLTEASPENQEINTNKSAEELPQQAAQSPDKKSIFNTLIDKN